MDTQPTKKIRWIQSLIACGIILIAMPSLASQPLQLHPENNHYFQFRGQPVVLMGSTEHYGALINLDFDYTRYLDEIHVCGLNVVRVFAGAYQEIPGSFNITDNTLSPAAGRAVLPWARTEIPGAADGGMKFDLAQWNATFFYRLRDFVKTAGQRGIVVELTFYSLFYNDELWDISPMNATNHINNVGAGGRNACFQITSDLLPYQLALVRKCVTELRDFDNVYYEIANEPYIGAASLAWQDRVTSEIVTVESSFPEKHLIAQNIANEQLVITDPNPSISIFNFHYALPEAALNNLGLNRALGDDETGYATNGERQDFPYRREAWEFMLSGGSVFNHLDYSFTASREDGLATAAAPGGGGPAIRRQLGVLRWFLEGLPLLSCTPQPGFVTGGVPTGATARAFGVAGEAYAVYLQGGSQADLSLNLPEGNYHSMWIDPRSGLILGEETFAHAGGGRIFSTPAYSEDIALKLSRGDSPPPVVWLSSPSYNAIVPSDQSAITISAEASVVGDTIESVEFFDAEKSLGISNTLPFSITVPELQKGPHVLRAKVLTTGGRSAISPPIKTTVLGPFHSGVNLNGTSQMVDGKVLMSQLEANNAGLTASNAIATSSSGLVSYPSPDPATQALLNSQLSLVSSAPPSGLSLEFPIEDGRYDLFLFLMESRLSYGTNVKIKLEGEVVATGIAHQALGEWHKYGPFRVTVDDGLLNIGLLRGTKGTPEIAGFSIYHADPQVTAQDANLSIIGDKDVVVLSYPSELPTAIVESTDSLGPESAWQPVTEPVSSFGDTNKIPLEVKPGSHFFRLKQEF